MPNTRMRPFSFLLLELAVALLRLQDLYVLACSNDFLVTHQSSSNRSDFATSIEVPYSSETHHDRVSKIEFQVREEESMIARIILSEEKDRLRRIDINGHSCGDFMRELHLSSPRIFQVASVSSYIFVTLLNNVSGEDVFCHARTLPTSSPKGDLTIQAVVPEDNHGVFLVSLPCEGPNCQGLQEDKFFLPFLLVTIGLLLALVAITVLAALLFHKRTPRETERRLLDQEAGGCTTPGRGEVRGAGRAGREAEEAEVSEDAGWWEPETRRDSVDQSNIGKDHYRTNGLISKHCSYRSTK